jgi:hypothetical protein
MAKRRGEGDGSIFYDAGRQRWVALATYWAGGAADGGRPVGKRLGARRHWLAEWLAGHENAPARAAGAFGFLASCRHFSGEPRGTRTPNPLIKSQLLYQLS